MICPARGTGAAIIHAAGWHQAGGRLRVPANITLLSLLPYAPELNPIENVWQVLAEHIVAGTAA